jgi:type III restriction enzyme
MGLGAVAITDHHDFAFVPFIRAAAKGETGATGEPLPAEQQLVVFPGLELTLAVPCQAILILDADFPDEWLGLVLTALAVHPEDPAQAKHAQVARLAHINNFPTLYEALSTQTVLKGRFIVLPNVGKGETSMMRDGFAPKYIEMPCVGGYVDGALSQLKPGKAAILDGQTKEWGNKPLGLFQTSDNRDRVFTQLGTSHTWVKWARPTAEALRQACLARRSRISQTEPALPAVQITRVEVSNSKFLGIFEIDLNAQYNALIGGRGTGKSSVLEYLRWALCDQPPTVEADDERPDFQQRRIGLIEKTLKPFDASVQVHALINGTEHVVRRYVADGRVLLKIGSDDMRPATELEVRTLLPIQAYSQKQLSSVGVKGEELERFVTLPIRGTLDALRSRQAETAAKIRAAHDNLREQGRLQKERSAARTELDSIEQRLLALRQSLSGVSPEDRKVIDAQPAWSSERTAIDQWRKEASKVLAEIQAIAERLKVLPSELLATNVNDPIRINAIREHFRGLYGVSATHLASAATAIAGPLEFQALLEQWDSGVMANAKKYEEAKSRAAQSESTLQQIGENETRQQELQAVVADHDRRLSELGNPEQAFIELREEWRRLHDERTALLEAQCAELSKQSKNWLRATVRKGAVVAPLTSQLKELVKGTKMRADKLFDLLLQAVATAADPVAAWLDVVAELRGLSEMDEPLTSPLPSCPRLGTATIGEQDRRRLAERLKAKGWADFAVAPLEDAPHFEYRAREGEYIEFSDASAGQQATALMHVLLAQGGPPLVIDQPEDDLDNHVIQDIVEEVWLAKSRRQIIFSSHNANLVVNGDAELVVCCDYRNVGDQSGGLIKVQGAIDIEAVRNEIAAVMEGGKEAFTLRKDKYGF